jgi:hypothetical protein
MNGDQVMDISGSGSGGVAAAEAPVMSAKAALAGILALASLSACVVSLLLVLVGLIQAFVVVMVLPVLGIAGAVLGYVSLREIGKSQGRLKGRVPALIGLFLGLLTASIQGAAGIGVLRTYMDAKNTLAPAMGRLFIAMDRGEESTAELHLSQSSETPGAAKRGAMIAALRAKFGACRGATFDLATISEGRALATAGGSTPTGPMQVDLPRTVRLVFERGEALLLVWLDNLALEKGEVRMFDGLVVVSKGEKAGVQGRTPPEVMVLREDGPGAKVAKGFGMRVLAYWSGCFVHPNPERELGGRIGGVGPWSSPCFAW